MIKKKNYNISSFGYSRCVENGLDVFDNHLSHIASYVLFTLFGYELEFRIQRPFNGKKPTNAHK